MSRDFKVFVVFVLLLGGIAFWFFTNWAHIESLDGNQTRTIADDMMLIHRRYYGTEVSKKLLPRPWEIPALIEQAIKAEDERVAKLAGKPHMGLATKTWQQIRPQFLRVAESKIIPAGSGLEITRAKHARNQLDLRITDNRRQHPYSLPLKDLG